MDIAAISTDEGCPTLVYTASPSLEHASLPARAASDPHSPHPRLHSQPQSRAHIPLYRCLNSLHTHPARLRAVSWHQPRASRLERPLFLQGFLGTRWDVWKQ